MLKKLWCLLWGHTYWEWVPVKEINYRTILERREYLKCICCDKPRC